ncbi:nitroreductase family deazaflavin-dependent oxidoreductase [Lentzea tibetensis]|uniref:Nitroreductase family deazaflavin-dependent oxidoreductase n=1 Tax=Lentzea tibetensis TaxID=2591470 RepID=A0A563EMM3_9PSEU|nr:nitroreductase/quinone reductase family protein [Lentzea tibetensis]TWP48438.1 nitroreductase family deazaflavin-dependent oxidoreductase [Lentzea tibetensis]
MATQLMRNLMRLGNSLGVSLYRRSHGRIGGGAKGLQVCLLTVPGRRTGQPHTVAVAFMEHDGAHLVMGSGGGQKPEPQWMRNLRVASRATIQIGDEVREVTPRITAGEERDRLWHDVVLARAPFFVKYEERSGRTIPIAVLR